MQLILISGTVYTLIIYLCKLCQARYKKHQSYKSLESLESLRNKITKKYSITLNSML